MTTAWTSRLSLAEVVADLGERQREVWTAIRNWHGEVGPSIEDIARVLEIKESSVCGRISELRKLGLLEDGPMKRNSSGHMAKTYRARAYRPDPAQDPGPPKITVDKAGQACFFEDMQPRCYDPE